MDQASLPTIGSPLEGGFFAGVFSLHGKPHALIVAPKAAGEIKSAWSSFDNEVAGARNFFDGLANTNAMAEAQSDVAQWARGLSIGGFTDWDIPAQDQLELLYRHFKPTTDENYVHRHGVNPSSLPVGYPYDTQTPAQTTVPAFREGGAEAFEPRWYWSSTQHSDDASYAWRQYFSNGGQVDDHKSFEGRVRAVRSIPL